jgi:hypothetical protein
VDAEFVVVVTLTVPPLVPVAVVVDDVPAGTTETFEPVVPPKVAVLLATELIEFVWVEPFASPT